MFLGNSTTYPPHFPPSPLKDVSTQFEGWGGGGGGGSDPEKGGGICKGAVIGPQHSTTMEFPGTVAVTIHTAFFNSGSVS